MIPFDKRMKQYYPIHVLHLWAATEKLIRQHKRGHNCDQCLYNAHKYIYGVPKFSKKTSLST